MYSPKCVHEIEKEKKKRRRSYVDGLMTIVGLVASLSSVPQVIKLWQTHDVSGISLATQLIALFAVIAWFVYGIYLKNKPLIITSFLTSLILSIVVIQMLVY